MTQHTHSTELAWMAGLFDGEGWVFIKESRRLEVLSKVRHALVIGITNSETNLLTPFLAWGGRIRPRKGTKLTRKPIFEWRIEAQKATAFLWAIRPYLRGKKAAKADLAIDFQWHIGKRFGRNKLGQRKPISREELQWRHNQKQLLQSA